MNVNVEKTYSRNVVILKLAGRLDGQHAPVVEKVLGELSSATVPSAASTKEAEKAARHLICELHEVPYVSSAGLRVLLLAAKYAKARQGQLMLVGVQPQVEEVLEMSGFLKLMSMRPTLEEALEALEARG